MSVFYFGDSADRNGQKRGRMPEVKVGNNRFSFQVRTKTLNHKFQLLSCYLRLFLKTADQNGADVGKVGLLQQGLKIAGKACNSDIAGIFNEQNCSRGKFRSVGGAEQKIESAEIAADKPAFRISRLQVPPAVVGDKFSVFLVNEP